MRTNRLVPILPWAACMLFPVAVAWPDAQRQPLQAKLKDYHLQRPELSVKPDERTSNFVIRYKEDGKVYTTVYEPPHKVIIVVSAEVKPAGNDLLCYEYDLHSSSESLQAVRAFLVEATGIAKELGSPTGWRTFASQSPSRLEWTYPIGSEGLEPGKRLAGFSYSSRTAPMAEIGRDIDQRPQAVFDSGTLPGIVACYAVGKAAILSFPTEGPDGLEELRPGYPYDGVSGRTIGAVAISMQEGPKALLEKLSAFAKESLAQGWLESADVYSKYGTALNQAGLALDQKDRHGAAAILRTIVGHAAIDLKAKRITTEANALIKYNAEFLIKWIEEK